MENLEHKILEELKKLNSSMSVKEVSTGRQPPLSFGESVVAEIRSINKNIFNIQQQLSNIQQKLDRKDS